VMPSWKLFPRVAMASATAWVCHGSMSASIVIHPSRSMYTKVFTCP